MHRIFQEDAYKSMQLDVLETADAGRTLNTEKLPWTELH